nr:MAG TPA: hypothetical protein [Caudoviricetes sp.]
MRQWRLLKNLPFWLDDFTGLEKTRGIEGAHQTRNQLPAAAKTGKPNIPGRPIPGRPFCLEA